MFIVPHSYPCLNKQSRKVILDCLNSDYVGHDPLVDEEIVKEFSSYLSFEYVNTTPSASISLMVILKFLSLSRKDEVIISSINCWSVYNIIQQEGGIPVVCDVRNDMDFRASYETIKVKITDNTKVIIVNHMYGNMIEMGVLKRIKKEYPNIYIIEDFSTSMFSHKEYRVGMYSDFSISSFGSTKPLTGGIGGLLASHKEIMDVDYSNKLQSDTHISLNIKLSRLNQVLILQQIRDYYNYQQMKKKIIGFYSEFVDIYAENTNDLFRAITFCDVSDLKKYLKRKEIELDMRNSVQPNLTKHDRLENNINAYNFKEYLSLPLNIKAYEAFVSIGVL